MYEIVFFLSRSYKIIHILLRHERFHSIEFVKQLNILSATEYDFFSSLVGLFLRVFHFGEHDFYVVYGILSIFQTFVAFENSVIS